MKNTLRKEILDKRKKLDSENLIIKSDKIKDSIIETDFYKNAKVIMAYIDFRNEVKTENFIKKAISDGKRVVIPISIVETRQLLLSEIIDYDRELDSGAYGILEPKKEYIREVDPDLVDLVLVPGVAFDRRGYRIGYGAGYYDRFLEKLRNETKKIALAFDLQIVEHAYEDSHDFPVEYIVTESEIIECNK
ncbi:MAG: 5-formyltetrahydrofolate cyclo-ligase [Andreesenia angusta]|nr:5-formyltetrahydrofolate cyclo-ligase [Andreesenia angusta]